VAVDGVGLTSGDVADVKVRADGGTDESLSLGGEVGPLDAIASAVSSFSSRGIGGRVCVGRRATRRSSGSGSRTFVALALFGGTGV
jgi:hypothetical protein